MSEFKRYAIYFAPRPGTALARLGRDWLGVDAEKAWVGPPPTSYVDSPRRYGFHATLKAPMRLANGVDYAVFRKAVGALANELKPVELGTLFPKRIGSFLALATESEYHKHVAELAFSCVQTLDGYRAPLTDQERAKRKGLTSQERDLMERWGYPYVGEAFRFHMTLTSALADDDLNAAESAVLNLVPEEPAVLDALSIFGDPGHSKPFVLLERFDLKG